MRRLAAVGAAAAVTASLDAAAHGGGVPAWVPAAFLIAFGGFVACLLAPLAVGTGSLLVRFGIGVALALGTFAVWYWLFVALASASDYFSPSTVVGAAVIGFLTFAPWITPVVVVVRAMRRRYR